MKHFKLHYFLIRVSSSPITFVMSHWVEIMITVSAVILLPKLSRNIIYCSDKLVPQLKILYLFQIFYMELDLKASQVLLYKYFQIHWYHNSSQISYSGPRPGVSMITDKSPTSVLVTLIISVASSTDTGVYTCSPGHLPSANVTVNVLEQTDYTAMLSLSTSIHGKLYQWNFPTQLKLINDRSLSSFSCPLEFNLLEKHLYSEN